MLIGMTPRIAVGNGTPAPDRTSPIRHRVSDRARQAVVVLAVAWAVALTIGAPTSVADRSAYRWPIDPRPQVARPFAPGEENWLPGHRGADLAAAVGTSVRAAGAGTVLFAGPVGGKPVVSVDHGNGLRTTYEPVEASVRRGERVRTGDTIGVLVAGHEGCPSPACLHLGLRRDREYLDPIGLFGRRPIVLRPFPVDGAADGGI